MKVARFISYVQGFYYIITGFWPVIHINSFMAVTGPKVDIWLVKTLGLMFAAIGLGLLANTKSDVRNRGVVTIALLVPLFISAIDIYYASVGRISPIYYLDALAEVLIMIFWLIALLSPVKHNR